MTIEKEINEKVVYPIFVNQTIIILKHFYKDNT